MLPENLRATIKIGSWPIPPIFSHIQKVAGLDDKMMYNTFNMGIGMIIAVDRARAGTALKFAGESGCPAYVIGSVAEGESGVDLC
jgi:phosphoribosylformylglycinamidine cyclo-ligase